MWVGFNIVIIGLLCLDLHLSRSSSSEHVKHAALTSAIWVGLAFAFTLFLAATKGEAAAYTFLVGYLVEKTLSVDNLLVMMLIFKSFRIIPENQPRILKWGIMGAIVMRAVFIVAGVRLIESFEWMVPLFGVTLLVAAFKMIRENKDEGAEEDFSDSFLVRGLKAVCSYDEHYQGGDFFSRNIGSAISATPLLAALLIIEFSDVVFAIDSIPCILGITQDLFLVYSSNMLAILGLRSLYVLLAGAMHQVRYLHVGLSLVLGFVGAKMVMPALIPPSIMEPPTPLASLSFIFLVVCLTMVGSLWANGQAQPDCTTIALRPTHANTRSVLVRSLFAGGHRKVH